ncbi:conserved oligomeric Golgi complex subunit 8-like [Ptychodera flava]|uniref:conserved oligomeric Golgi complex subunit 8-like n=1 Tax=Ptychodera flava TaxID=63121 RepID=UPI003969BC9A
MQDSRNENPDDNEMDTTEMNENVENGDKVIENIDAGGEGIQTNADNQTTPVDNHDLHSNIDDQPNDHDVINDSPKMNETSTTDKNASNIPGKEMNVTQSEKDGQDVNVSISTNYNENVHSQHVDTCIEPRNSDNMEKMEISSNDIQNATHHESESNKSQKTHSSSGKSAEERVLTPPSPFPPSPCFSPATGSLSSTDSNQPISVELSDSSLPGPSSLFNSSLDNSQDLFLTPAQILANQKNHNEDDDIDEITSMTSELSDISQTAERNRQAPSIQAIEEFLEDTLHSKKIITRCIEFCPDLSAFNNYRRCQHLSGAQKAMVQKINSKIKQHIRATGKPIH